MSTKRFRSMSAVLAMTLLATLVTPVASAGADAPKSGASSVAAQLTQLKRRVAALELAVKNAGNSQTTWNVSGRVDSGGASNTLVAEALCLNTSTR